MRLIRPRTIVGTVVLTITAMVVFLGFWVGALLHVGPLDDPPLGFVHIVVSIAYGFIARRWWAPLVFLAALPAFAYPQAYGIDNPTPGGPQPDYSNGVVAAVILTPMVMALIGLGVLLAKLTERFARSRRSEDPLPKTDGGRHRKRQSASSRGSHGGRGTLPITASPFARLTHYGLGSGSWRNEAIRWSRVSCHQRFVRDDGWLSEKSSVRRPSRRKWSRSMRGELVPHWRL